MSVFRHVADVAATNSGSALAGHRRYVREATWTPSRSAARRDRAKPRSTSRDRASDARDRDSKPAPVERAARSDHEAMDSRQPVGEGPYYLALHNQVQIGVEVRRFRAPRRNRAATARSRSAAKRPIPATPRRTPARAVIFRIETAVATGSTTVF